MKSGQRRAALEKSSEGGTISTRGSLGGSPTSEQESCGGGRGSGWRSCSVTEVRSRAGLVMVRRSWNREGDDDGTGSGN
ncbi:vegetative cell wall protein gp1-like [Iris pallida]|uniref:Vegetative cell wall protein gp1-like n=1 Tax=Iris pallida TaxID=29817 RepID=A0AAX6GDP7_IRIPA|nr:vegetative cell wall protein gp1-like [Iris pallida]